MKPNLNSTQKKRLNDSYSNQKVNKIEENPDYMEKSYSSTNVKETIQEVRLKHKHKIGPKKVQFFTFKENRK